MADPQPVPFRVFEAAGEIGELHLESWGFGFDGETFEVITADAHYLGPQGPSLAVRTMPLGSSVYPRSDDNEVFARTSLSFAVMRSEAWRRSPPETIRAKARAARREAIASDASVQVDGVDVSATRLAGSGFVASVVRLNDVRIVLAGVSDVELSGVRTCTVPVYYHPPNRQ